MATGYGPKPNKKPSWFEQQKQRFGGDTFLNTLNSQQILSGFSSVIRDMARGNFDCIRNYKYFQNVVFSTIYKNEAELNCKKNRELYESLCYRASCIGWTDLSSELAEYHRKAMEAYMLIYQYMDAFIANHESPEYIQSNLIRLTDFLNNNYRNNI